VQSGKAGAEGRGLGDQTGLSGSNWIMKKNGGFVEVYCFVGVPTTDDFEHLTATIAEATPLYELCASVLE
jgi:hypothetical protein